MAMPLTNDVLPLVFSGIDAEGTVLLITDDITGGGVLELGTELLGALAELPVLAEANAELDKFVESVPEDDAFV